MISDLVKHAKRIPTWVLVSTDAPDVKLVKKTSDVEELEKSLDSLEYRYGEVNVVESKILEGGGNIQTVFLIQPTRSHVLSKQGCYCPTLIALWGLRLASKYSLIIGLQMVPNKKGVSKQKMDVLAKFQGFGLKDKQRTFKS